MLVQTAGYERGLPAENAVLGGQGARSGRSCHTAGSRSPDTGAWGRPKSRRAPGGNCGCVVSYADLDRAVIDGRTEGFCKLIVARETHRLVERTS